jgi:hypothetical protein
VAEAKRILAAAPVLAGAVRHHSAPSKLLKGPPDYPQAAGLVTRARYWTTAVGATQAFKRLTAKPPAGFRSEGSGEISERGVITLRFVDDSVKRLPPRIASGDLLMSVSRLKDGKTGIGVYAETVPQPRRSAAENVPTSVTTVALSWTVSSEEKHPLTRTITGYEASRLVTAFNALQVSTRTGPVPCPLNLGSVQTATFTGDGHTWVATGDNCGDIDVTRDGKRLPALTDGSAYDRQLRRALGLDAVARKAAEHVPASVHTVRLARTTSTGTTTRTVRHGKAGSLVQSFDELSTVRAGLLTCDATGATTTATFTDSAHTWVASQDPCGLVTVTRDGRSQPTLVDDGFWSQFLAAALRH